MQARDWDYIENRLLSGFPHIEAWERLRELGHTDLADRLMKAAQSFQDTCREIRDELHEKDGRGR